MTREPAGFPPDIVAWTTVTVLSLTYLVSFLDRQILVLLIEPIKQDLGISDTGASVLTGMAFAMIYTVMGIPMGRAADLYTRKHVIIAGVVVWSSLTVLSGFARNFWQLFVARMGVGVGEAALTPAAYAMVADLFPPSKLGRGMSVFVLGSSVGSAVSLLLGGALVAFAARSNLPELPMIGDLRPWQLVLILAGLLSSVMIVPLALIREPVRQGRQFAAGNTPGGSLSFRQVMGYMFSSRQFYGPYILGISALCLMLYGTQAWIPTYFIRILGWEASYTGIQLGIINLVPSLVGGIFAGWLADRMRSLGQLAAPIKIMVVMSGVLMLLMPAFVVIPQIHVKLGLLVLHYFVVAMIVILFPAVIQLATPGEIRSQVSAVILFAINLVGIGFGPTSIALITDYVFRDDGALGFSIAVVGLSAGLIGVILLRSASKSFEKQSAPISGDVDAMRQVSHP